MIDGDIFGWRWKDEKHHADSGPYRSYHCKSRIAVVEGGRLYDTYWHGRGDSSLLDPDRVVLTLKGNLNDLVEVPYYFAPFYRREDLVDMRHANNTNGKIYRKPEAVRDPQTMLELAAYERKEAESAIRAAQFRIEHVDQQIERINTGKIDEVTL